MPSSLALSRAPDALTRSPRLSESPAAVYLARLAPGSRSMVRRRLTIVAQLVQPGSDPLAFPWHALDYAHTQAIRAQIVEAGYAPSTGNAILAALRSVVREAWRLGQMPVEQCERACDVKAIKGHRTSRGRALAPEEISRLLGICDDGTSVGIRDACLLAVLYSAGLRRAELVALDLRDCSIDDGSVHVRSGKGNRDRLVYLAAFAIDRLVAYRAVRGTEPGPLLYRAYRGDRLSSERLSDQAVRYICRKRAEQAGVSEFACHDVRRSFASNLLDAGVDLSTVQSLMGHSSPAVTVKYDKRGETRKRKAVQALQIE